MNKNQVIDLLLQLKNDLDNKNILSDLGIDIPQISKNKKETEEVFQKLFFIDTTINLPSSWIAGSIISVIAMKDKQDKEKLISLLIDLYSKEIVIYELVVANLKKVYLEHNNPLTVFRELLKMKETKKNDI